MTNSTSFIAEVHPHGRVILGVKADPLNRYIAARTLHESRSAFVPNRDIDGGLFHLLWHAKPVVGVRASLEVDDTCRQLLPYVIIRKGNRFLQYSRTRSGGEAKLYDKTSIGWGGHVESADFHDLRNFDGFVDTLITSCWREMQEELSPSFTREMVARAAQAPLGLIIDNPLKSNGVEWVHVAIVLQINVPEDFEIECTGDKSIDGRRWVSWKELFDDKSLERWSNIITLEVLSTEVYE